MGKNLRIDSREQMIALAKRLGVRPDWHEPDERDVTARVLGDDLDNAGFWGTDAHGALVTYGEGRQELWVEISQHGQPVAEISLATLLAIASEGDPAPLAVPSCQHCSATELSGTLLSAGTRGRGVIWECEDRSACLLRLAT